MDYPLNIIAQSRELKLYLVIARMDLKTHWLCNSFNRRNYNFCWFTGDKTCLSLYIILLEQQTHINWGNASDNLEKITLGQLAPFYSNLKSDAL